MKSAISAAGTGGRRGIAAALVFQVAFLQAALADHDAVRHADQFPVGEHHARTHAAVVDDHVHAGRLQLGIQLLGLGLDHFAAVIAHRAQHHFERRDRRPAR